VLQTQEIFFVVAILDIVVSSWADSIVLFDTCTAGTPAVIEDDRNVY
jgi:hypothetical protein